MIYADSLPRATGTMSPAWYAVHEFEVTGAEFVWGTLTSTPQSNLLEQIGLKLAIAKLTTALAIDAELDGEPVEVPTDLAAWHALSALNVGAPRFVLPQSIEAMIDGGIALTYQAGGRIATLECLNSGSLLLSLQDVMAKTSQGGKIDAGPGGIARAIESLVRPHLSA